MSFYRPIHILVILLLLSVASIAQSDKEIDKKVNALLKKMTLDEKIGQMNQYNGFWDVTGPVPADDTNKQKYADLESGKVGSMINIKGVDNVRKIQEIVVNNSRLGIPLIFGFDVIHGHKTMFPIPLAEASSWDLGIIEMSARIAAIEASAEGINWVFAPMVDISRDPRWGRVMEGAGEDTYLGSKIAAARVRGFQGKDLSATNTVAACAKHFAGYGFSESGKDYNAVDVGTSTLYNTILPPFKACVDEGVSTFMNSFNTLNDIPATGSKFLQRDILKSKWNFKGFVVSDWGSIGEMVAHNYANDLSDAAYKAVIAGSDMDMESNAYIKYLSPLVKKGTVDVKLLDDAVRRILKVKFQLGLFDDPYKYCDSKREKEFVLHKDHYKAALDVAKKSIVLLKNDNDLLPLPKAGKKIAVIGALAFDKNSPLGSWRLAAEDNSAISLSEGISKYGGNTYLNAAGPKLGDGKESFITEVKINNTDTLGFALAVDAASKADIVVIMLGELGYQSGEGRSRANPNLPGLQELLLEKVTEVNKNVVLVVASGRPLLLNWAQDHVASIVQSWHLGSASGDAIASVLYGDYNPSGKLPMSFPRSVGQIPIYYNTKSTGRPGPIDLVFWSHYGDELSTPLYPFGHGLSYTKFAYSDLKVNTDKDRKLNISVKVSNVGKYDGEEVIQVYIQDKKASISRPIKELKAFTKKMIRSGKDEILNFVLTPADLGFYDSNGTFMFEPGEFDIMVGGSSHTVLKANVYVK